MRRGHCRVSDASFADLLVELFGESGKHARSAVGVSELPLGVYDADLSRRLLPPLTPSRCVEVEMVLEVK